MKNLSNLILLCFISLACLLSSCNSEVSEEKTTAPEYSSGLYLENMDTTIKPGDNFQMYVNGNWIKESEIPADKSSYGIFAVLNDESEKNAQKIIETASHGENAAGSDEQKVGDLYNSYLDMETRNGLGNEPLKAEFERINVMETESDLASYFAHGNKLQYDLPFANWVYFDLKEPSKYALYTWQGGLGLPDKEYYFKEGEKSENIRTEYVKHIEEMLAMAEVENPTEAAQSIMALEMKMAEVHWDKEKTRDMMSMYNAVPISELKDLMPDFDWNAYLAAADATEVEYLVVTQLSYLKSLNNILKETDLKTWKTYLKWCVVNHVGTRLDNKFDEQNFAFRGKVMRGLEEQQESWKRAVGVVNSYLGEVIGKIYVKEHFPPSAKERMVTLVDNLLKAYEVSIKELDWMSDATKQEALKKLSKITTKIGYPDEWKSYPAEIKKDDLFGNLKRSDLAEYDRNMGKLGNPVDKKEWGMNPQTVNAYYNPSLNEIVFPAAILQPPYFDLNADDAANYGAIGGVIGHEIGHGFDDQGSTFDGDGVLRDWWTEEDKAEFKNRTNALVAQYSGFKVFDDLNVNGAFTLGENIGDLGGLSIALKAYEISLNGTEAPEMDGFSATQRVFLGWAQAWRSKSREEALRRMVQTNPHSPALFRVNGVVRNIPAFYEAFNVQEGDELYLAPEERVKIW